MMAVSANDDNNTIISSKQNNDIYLDIQNDIYVSPDGNDENGNGSFESPYGTIKHAVNSAEKNSKIILKDGIYKGESNTNLNINKDLTIESTSDNVTINGESKNYFFKINAGSSLTLNNIKFINGYTNSFSQLSVINNQGNLLVNNSSFNSMNSIMSTFYNNGKLIIDNTVITNSKSQNMAKSISNIGECTIINSKITDTIESDMDLPTVYNYKNININNSQVSYIASNDYYDPSNYQTTLILIENSKITLIDAEYSNVNISNTNINGRFSFINSNVFMKNTDAISTWSSMTKTLSIFDSNFTAIHSVFASSIATGHSNNNITYSIILQTISGGNGGYLYAPYNWWGVNSGPQLEYFNNNYNTDYWAIATFEVEDNNLSVGTNSKFITSLNKWTDGNSILNFVENEYLPQRTAVFEAQNGKFLNTNKILNSTAENYLINNYLDCTVYSIVDNQRLSLTIGGGYSAYSYFVAPWGHDGPGDGTLESPFQSLSYAVSRVVDGNTICMLEGTYKGSLNSQISISKNITIVGLGSVTLLRANGANMFSIREWGNLNINNINFGVEVREYNENLFVIRGGNLTIENCTFTGITSNAVITSSSGVSNIGQLLISNSAFTNIVGSVVNGPVMVQINTSTFEKISNYYHNNGFEHYNALFTVTSSIEIYNSLFSENTMGIITLHPFTYSTASLLGASYSQYYKDYNRYAYVENTTFTNNIFTNMNNPYSTNGIGLEIYDNYGSFNGFINKCSFINNTGKITVANNVNNTEFISNHGMDYGGKALVQATSIDNSLFLNNLNRYIDGSNAYIGEGIASADIILNSTFINNKAAFGGAVANTKEVHYSVFVNNTAEYGGNDIYSYSGDVDYSSNWWGDNQKPDTNKIFIFLGNLKLTDWITMAFESVSGNTVEASLNRLMDENENIKQLGFNIPIRPVFFSMDTGNITPNASYTSNNAARATVEYDINSSDFKAYAKIDNQILELDLRNTNTRIIISNVTVKGNSNNFNIDLINVNGHKISNQTLIVEVINNDDSKVFTVKTDEKGHGSFKIDYPVGKYNVNVNYLGDGYFEKSNATATIEVISSLTELTSYNFTYYGKNNVFYAILHDENGKNLINYTISFTIISSNGEYRTVKSNTDSYGRSEIVLTLGVGEYDIKIDYAGDSWYAPSSSKSHIIVKPVNSTLTVPTVTLYGSGNVYNITLKDTYGTLIRGENIHVSISQANQSDNFILTTGDDGTAKLTVNYVPGTYNIKATYLGDNIYGAAKAEGVITVEKVLTVVSGFHYKIIPLNGIYTVVLSDMYGHRVNNGTITLNCYQGKLVKSYKLNTDANGEASFIIDLDEGTYLTTMDYDGGIWYASSTGAATIVIDKDATLESIYINSTDMVQYYGENKFLAIEFNDPNAYNQYGKTITVILSSGTWSQTYNIQTDVFGVARMQIKLNPGEYNVTYKYSNPYYNIYGSGSNKITVYKMPITMQANDLIMKAGESRIFSVTLKDMNNASVKNMQVHMTINGNEYDVATNEKGIADLILNLNAGNYTIDYSVDNPNYNYISDSRKIIVVDTEKTLSQLSTNNIEAYENETINMTVKLLDVLGNGISNSRINLEILKQNGDSVKNITGSTDNNGELIFSFNLEDGNYIAKLTYDGNEEYIGSSHISSIIVESVDNRTKTIIYSGEVQLTNVDPYNIVLTDADGKLLSDKEIKFYIGDAVYNFKTDDDGKAQIYLSRPGVYSINAVFEGDNDYKAASSITKVYVSSALTRLYAPELVKYYKNGTQFHALLVSGNGNPLKNKTINVIINNVNYTCNTDENGWISLDINLKPGVYGVECNYYGKSELESSFNKTTITVLTTIIGENAVKYYGDSPYLSVKFLDSTGKGINNTKFLIGIDDKNYVAVTDDNGVFEFNTNLKSGTHIITVTNPYDGLVENYRLTVQPTIYVDTIVKVLGDGKSYVATFFDKNGEGLANKKVYIIINGVNHTYKTNAFGEVSLNMELTPDDYLVTAINPVTGEYVENTIHVFAPIIENSNLNMYFNNGSSYKVRIVGEGGKVAGAGELVIFKVNGKTYNVKTDKNGYASLKISLKPKTYTITAKYGGYKVSNKLVVKPVLTAKNISKKKHGKVTFKAKLVNGKGKPAHGKKITFKFKGKKYKAKTNSKGIATIKLTLKKGKYTIYSFYGKSKIKNTIVVKK